MANDPYFSKMLLRCGKCENRWTAWQPTNCHARVWIAAAKAHKCPKCGSRSRSVFIVTEPEPADTKAKAVVIAKLKDGSFHELTPEEIDPLLVGAKNLDAVIIVQDVPRRARDKS